MSRHPCYFKVFYFMFYILEIYILLNKGEIQYKNTKVVQYCVTNAIKKLIIETIIKNL